MTVRPIFPRYQRASTEFIVTIQIGLEHGQKAARLVQGSVAFYSQYFMETSKMDWTTACSTAAKFIPFIEQQVPDLVEEMRGMGITSHT